MGEISKLFIIQSLKTTDTLKSGEELYNKLSATINSSFRNVENSTKFLGYIDEIKSELVSTEGKYVIHFDCHGNENGIGFFDKNNNQTFIEWEELREKLREVYLVTKQKTIISFSSCKGFNVMKLLADFKPCPYYLITGSLLKIGFQISVDGYELFYIDIDSGGTIDHAMHIVREDFPLLEFLAYTAEQLVELGWQGYLADQAAPEKVSKRRADVISQAIAKYGTVTEADIAKIDRRLSQEGAAKDRERYFNVFFS